MSRPLADDRVPGQQASFLPDLDPGLQEFAKPQKNKKNYFRRAA